MLTRAEVARGVVYAAGVTLDGRGVGDPDRMVAAAKITAGDAAMANGKSCIQVHGGMGFTSEVDAHLYLKRAIVLDTWFGSVDDHSEAVARELVRIRPGQTRARVRRRASMRSQTRTTKAT